MKPKSSYNKFITARMSSLVIGSCAIGIPAALISSPGAHAASDSWNFDAAGNWTDTTKWLSGTQAPGSTTTDNPDVATFSTTLTGIRTVTVDATRYIGGISFENTSAFRYVLSGGALRLNSGSVIQTLAANGNHTDTISSPIRISGESGTLAITAGATSASSTLTISGALTGNSSGVNASTLTLNGANTGSNIISGAIGDGAAGGKLALVKDGDGKWEMRNTAAHTYTGDTTINGGTLQIGSGSTAGSLSPNSAIGGAGGTLFFKRSDAVTQGTHFGSVIGGSISVNQNGAGATAVLTLNGLNTFSGGTTLSGTGQLNINSAGSGGTSSAIGTGTLTIGGGTIDNTSAGPVTLSTANAVALNANFTFGGTQDLTIGGAASTAASRTITLNGSGKVLTLGVFSFTASTANSLTVNSGDGSKLVLGGVNLSESGTNRTRTLNGTGAIEITGEIANGGGSTASALTYGGSSTLTLSGASTFGGLMRVTNGGTVVLKGGDDRLPTTTALWLGLSSETIGATVRLGDASGHSNQTVDTLNTNGSGTFAVVGGNASVSTLTVSGAANGTFAGTIGGAGTNENNLALTKSGAGTLTLSGTNTYTGETNVNGGTLAIGASGSLANTTTTIGIGGTLAGGGTIGGATTIQGTHSPGFSPGTQTFTTGLSYADTATLNWELTDNTTGGRGTIYDAVNVTGGSFAIATGATIALSFGGTVDFLNAFWALDQEWLVVDLSGSATAADSNGFNIGSISGGANWDSALGSFGILRKDGSSTEDSVYLTWTAIPEPRAALLGGFGLLLLLRRRRSN
jgi:fibronectin-binding autotransporter adhesin